MILDHLNDKPTLNHVGDGNHPNHPHDEEGVYNTGPGFVPSDAEANATISSSFPNTGSSTIADFTETYIAPSGSEFRYAPGMQGGIGQFLTGEGQKQWEAHAGQTFTGFAPFQQEGGTVKQVNLPTGLDAQTSEVAQKYSAVAPETSTTPTSPDSPTGKKWIDMSGQERSTVGSKPGEGVYAGGYVMAYGPRQGEITDQMPWKYRDKLDVIRNFDYENQTPDALITLLTERTGRVPFLPDSSSGHGMDFATAKEVAAQAFSEANPGKASEYYAQLGITAPTDVVGEPKGPTEAQKAIDYFHEQMTGLVGRRNFEDFIGDPTARNNLAYISRMSFAMPKGWSFTTKENGEIQLTPPSTDKESPLYVADAASLTPEQQSKLSSALQMQQDARQMQNRVEEQMVYESGQEGIRAHDIAMQDARIADAAAARSDQAIENMAQQQHEQRLAEMSNEIARARNTNEATAIDQQRQMADLQRELDRERYLAELGSAEGMQTSEFAHQIEMSDSLHDQKLAAIDHQHNLETNRMVSQSVIDRRMLDHKAGIDTKMQELRDSGAMDRLVKEIEAEALSQGKQIDHEVAMQIAEADLKKALQTEQLAHEVSQLTTQGQQAISNLQESGAQERMTLAKEIESRELMAGNQITSTEAIAKADREMRQTLHQAEITAQQQQQTTAGEQAISQIQETGAQERLTLQESASIAEQQRLALGLTTAQEALTNAQTVSSSYVSNLSTAIASATQTGDYTAVEQQLGQPLPPSPSGIVWDEANGVFQQRAGFEGREIDAATQQWIATVTPAFKARARAEQATSQATRIQQDLMARQTERQQAEEEFRQNMLTGDIDSAEEANARRVMAETAAIATEQKMEHVKMLMSLIQNPVQLGMAKRHGLLGQIESVLGFTMSGVPDSSGMVGSVPTMNEWQTMDSEAQAFNLATYVEQGGSPDEFLRMIAGSVPAQMQQIQYGVV